MSLCTKGRENNHDGTYWVSVSQVYNHLGDNFLDVSVREIIHWVNKDRKMPAKGAWQHSMGWDLVLYKKEKWVDYQCSPLCLTTVDAVNPDTSCPYLHILPLPPHPACHCNYSNYETNSASSFMLLAVSSLIITMRIISQQLQFCNSNVTRLFLCNIFNFTVR